MPYRNSNHPVEILLVEDNADDAELTLHALEKDPLAPHVEVVRDGVGALDFIFCKGRYAKRDIRNTPKVILLDMKLPKVDGLDVLQKIKSDPRTRSIPVVMLTSSREMEGVVESYRLGVNSYVTKPIDFDQFTRTVQQLGHYWLQLNEHTVL